MKRYFLILLVCISCQQLYAQAFVKTQLTYGRVRTAKAEKDSVCRSYFTTAGISSVNNIFIRVFKSEQQLELWALKGDKYVKVKEYKVCAPSGTLGPKRIMGDGQVPEGFYTIDRFNPQSNFYLSLGVSYPNAADLKRNSKNPGGDIFIHGDCVTIGCMPIQDEFIKELYWICVLAKGNGQQRIPVHIFPCRMTESNMKVLQGNKTNYPFWQNLKTGYDYFEKSGKLPAVTVTTDGKYSFK